MAAKLEEETTKIHVHIYKSDLDELDASMCRAGGQRTIGRSEAIRHIVRAWLTMNRRKRNAKPIQYDPSIADLIPPPEPNLEPVDGSGTDESGRVDEQSTKHQ